MARKKKKTEEVIDEHVISKTEPIEDTVSTVSTVITDTANLNKKKYVVELYDEASKTRSVLADNVSGDVAVFSSEAEAKASAQKFLKLINGVIPYSYYIRETNR